MDIVSTHAPSNKENMPPSPSNVSYPELPQASPAKRQKHMQPFKAVKKHQTVPPNSPASYQDAFIGHSAGVPPKSPANIGRSRGASNLAARLQQTPPRASYANKVEGIFSQADLRSRSNVMFPGLVRDDLFLSPEPTISVASTNSDGSSSSLTSESDLEKKLDTTSPFQIEEDKVRKASSMNAAAAVWTQPPPPLRLVIPYREDPNPGKEVPQPEAPITTADSSSDEWTGDEEFLPKAARQKARMLEAQKAREREREERIQREAEERTRKQQLDRLPNFPMRPGELCELAQRSRDVKGLLQTSPESWRKKWGVEWTPRSAGSPSRFTPIPRPPSPPSRERYRSPKKKQKKPPRSHKSSDADDEEDGDPDR